MNQKRQIGRRAASMVWGAALLAASAWGAKPDSVPDWVREAARQPLPAYAPETRAVVLLEEVTYTVAADGQAVEHLRKVVKILRPNGRDEGMVSVNFDKDTKIVSMHVWSIAPDGHEYAVKDDEMREFGFGNGNLFVDDKVKAANPPGRDPGGIVAYEYEQKIRPYLTEYTWFFQDDLPHVQQSFTLQLPPGFTFGTVWAHHAPVQAADLENQRSRWALKDTPTVDMARVPMHPSAASLEGRMTVHYAGPGLPLATDGTWSSIGEWYDRLSHDRLAATPDIAAKATELTAGKSDFYDKAEAIGEYVQKDVRYFDVEVGIGGFQPHFANDIFHNKYGDCKDKATLVSAMLSTVGIHAALMMVDHRRGVVDPDAPSIVGLDHMITAIEIPKDYQSDKLRSVVTARTGKRYLIFDPTWEKTPFGQLEHNLQGGYGLLMEGHDSQVIALPVLKPGLNTISRSAHFQLSAEGDLTGTVTERRFGDISETSREVYATADEKKQQAYMDEALKADFTAFSVKDVKLENVHSLNKDLSTTFTVDAEHFGKNMGTLLMIRPRVLGSEELYADHKKREVPIDLKETMVANDEYEIDLPPGYAVDEMPDPVSIDLGFAAYASSTQVKGNSLHYTRTYTVREVTVPAEKYGEVQKLAGVIAADEQGKAILKKQ